MTINLTFAVFDMQLSFDFVSVSSCIAIDCLNSSLLFKGSGDSLPPVISVNARFLLVQFDTNGVQNGYRSMFDGFYAFWSTSWVQLTPAEAVCAGGDLVFALTYVSDSSAVCNVGPHRAVTPSLYVSLGHLYVDVVSNTRLSPVIEIDQNDTSFNDSTANQYSVQFFYDAPIVTKVTAGNLSTLGGSMLNVSGQNFGKSPAADEVVILGRTACLQSTWTSDTAMSCVADSGSGLSVEVAVMRWEVLSRGGPSARFVRPVVDFRNGSRLALNGPGTGGTLIPVPGSGFGPSSGENQTMVVGQSGSACVLWTSDSSVLCPTPARILANGGLEAEQETPNFISLMVGGQLSVNVGNPVIFSYDSPVVTGVAPSYGSTDGLPVLTIFGQNFGTAAPADDEAQGYIDGNPCYKPSGLASDAGPVLMAGVDWVSDSSLLCSVMPGSGVELDVEATLYGFDSVLSAAFSYIAVPTITSAPQTSPHPSQSYSEFAVYGSRFSLPSSDSTPENPNATIFVGQTPCNLTTWIADSTLICRVGPGLGVGLDISVQILSGVATLAEAFSYLDPPVVTAVVPTQDIITGGSEVTILGRNFGYNTSLASVFIGSTDCVTTTWVSTSSILCIAPSSELIDDLSVTVSVLGQIGSLANAFQYSGAGVVPRLGLTFPLPILWLDASTPSDLVMDGPIPSLNYVGQWNPRLQPPKLQSQPDFYFTQADASKRPLYVGGAVRFDGINDALVSNRILIRPQNMITLIAAVRPGNGFTNRPGSPYGCVFRPVIWASNDLSQIFIQSVDDGAFAAPSAGNSNPSMHLITGDGAFAGGNDPYFYVALEFKADGEFIAGLKSGYLVTSPPGKTFPPTVPTPYSAVPNGFTIPCAAGWVLSDNDVSVAREGLGIMIDEDHLVRPVAGMDYTSVSGEPMAAGWHVITMQVSDSAYNLYIDSSAEAGFQMVNDGSNPQLWAAAKVLAGTLPMTLGSTSSGMQGAG